MNIFDVSWFVLKESRQMKITDYLAGLGITEPEEEEDPYEEIWDEMEEEDAPPPPAQGGLGGLGPGKVGVASRELEPIAEKVAVVDSEPGEQTHLRHPKGRFRYLGPASENVAVEKPKTEVKSNWKKEQEAQEAALTDEERQDRVADIVGRSIRAIQHRQLAEGIDVNMADSPAITSGGKEIAREGDETGGRRMEPWLSNAPCDQCGKHWKDFTAGERTTCTLCTKAKEQGKLAERLDKLHQGSGGKYGKKREAQPEAPKLTDWTERLTGGSKLGGLGSD